MAGSPSFFPTLLMIISNESIGKGTKLVLNGFFILYGRVPLLPLRIVYVVTTVLKNS